MKIKARRDRPLKRRNSKWTSLDMGVKFGISLPSIAAPERIGATPLSRGCLLILSGAERRGPSLKSGAPILAAYREVRRARSILRRCLYRQWTR